MGASEYFKTLDDKLQWAIVKMIKGVKIQLTEEGRKDFPRLTGRWFYIISIDHDQSITIQDEEHGQASGLELKDIKV